MDDDDDDDGRSTLPVDINAIKSSLQLILRVFGRSCNRCRHLELPALAGRAVRPGDFPQRRLVLPVKMIHPHAEPISIITAFDEDSDALLARADQVSAGHVCDTPVRVVVRADGRETRSFVKVFDAGLDPLPVTTPGEGEQNASLVELLRVSGAEADGGRKEV